MHHGSEPPGSRIAQPYAWLLELGRALTATRRPDGLYQALHEQVRRLLDPASFAILIHDAETDVVTVAYYAGSERRERPRLRYRGSEIPAIRQGAPVLETGDRSGMTVPLHGDGRVLGALSAQARNGQRYGAAELALLSAVADLGAAALAGAWHVQESERRRQEAERLEEIGRALSASLELTGVLSRVLEAARDLSDADGGAVWLLLGGDREVEVALRSGEIGPAPGARLPLSPMLHELVVERRETLVLESVPTHPLLSPEIRKAHPVASAIVVPLVAEDRVIGALGVGHVEARRYRRDDVRLQERLAQQAAIAVANARLHEEIRALSLTDALTGIPNRRHLDLFLEKEFAAARRGRRLTVAIFDLDDFKLYNDQVGHQAGDEALRLFARLLQGETRAMNLAARYGGDEFVSILADIDREGGLAHAGRVVRAVDAHPVLGAIGVSAGVASFAAAMNSARDLIAAADRDLYLRKAERRRERAGGEAGAGAGSGSAGTGSGGTERRSLSPP
jgi:diguanylate cyclase (GGDEF)-like protein